MYSKIFKTIWVISLLAATGTFLYAYATLPETVVFGLGTTSRGSFFYAALILLTVMNSAAFILPKLLDSDTLIAWFYGALATFHLFAVSSFIFLGVINSNETYDYSRLGPMVIGSFALFCGWLLVLPWVIRKKQAVL